MFEIRWGDDRTIEVSGRFTASEMDQAMAFFETVVDSATVDFVNLDYISSAGLGALFATHRRLTTAGHTFRVRNLNRTLRELFRISGFDRIFDIE